MAKKPALNDNNLAVCYYRYSSHAQNEASIEQQKERAKEYAEAHGFEIVKEYADAALSGTTDERPQYQLLLQEIGKIKPGAVILWKVDRLGRSRYDLAMARKIIREAGASIHTVAEAIPDAETPEGALIEGMMDTLAEFYSAQMRVNIMRGLNYNASNALYNGHKMLGYTVKDKRYVIDETGAGIVREIFRRYVAGIPIRQIIDDLTAQGVRSIHGNKFTHNSIRKILKNRRYTGVYIYGDYEIPGGMPQIISEQLFEEAQQRFELNRHKNTPRKEEPDTDQEAEPDNAPRFWLTGKLFCGKCGDSMHGVSGTGKAGKPYYYYACKSKRQHKCNLKNVQKDYIEFLVVQTLRELLHDTENTASLAVDIADYYRRINADDSYLKSLEQDLRQCEKAINNLIQAIEGGVISETITERLKAQEERKTALFEAIQAEKVKKAISENEISIQHFFEQYAGAQLDDAETRDAVFEYFIDKIYVYDDKIVVTFFYSDDNREIGFNEWSKVINGGTTGATDDAGGIAPDSAPDLAQCSTQRNPAPPEYHKANTLTVIIYRNMFALVKHRAPL